MTTAAPFTLYLHCWVLTTKGPGWAVVPVAEEIWDCEDEEVREVIRHIARRELEHLAAKHLAVCLPNDHLAHLPVIESQDPDPGKALPTSYEVELVGGPRDGHRVTAQGTRPEPLRFYHPRPIWELLSSTDPEPASHDIVVYGPVPDEYGIYRRTRDGAWLYCPQR